MSIWVWGTQSGSGSERRPRQKSSPPSQPSNHRGWDKHNERLGQAESASGASRIWLWGKENL
eukprot:761181-Prorocentrum_lima.AAC.1